MAPSALQQIATELALNTAATEASTGESAELRGDVRELMGKIEGLQTQAAADAALRREAWAAWAARADRLLAALERYGDRLADSKFALLLSNSASIAGTAFGVYVLHKLGVI